MNIGSNFYDDVYRAGGEIDGNGIYPGKETPSVSQRPAGSGADK